MRLGEALEGDMSVTVVSWEAKSHSRCV